MPAWTIDLASKGTTTYTIVCSEFPSRAEQRAATELADYLGQITGAKFPIADESKDINDPRILVGPSMISRVILGPKVVADLGQAQFIIRTVGEASKSDRFRAGFRRFPKIRFGCGPSTKKFTRFQAIPDRTSSTNH